MAVQIMQMVAIIVFIVFTAEVINNYIKHRSKMGKRIEQIERGIEARLARLDELEKRIRVVEKIVTDRRFDLADEFERLEKEQ